MLMLPQAGSESRLSVLPACTIRPFEKSLVMREACCSEPEAAALLALATQFKPHVWMNVHSGMEALFMPYDHLASIPKGKTAQATLEVQKAASNLPSLRLKPFPAWGPLSDLQLPAAICQFERCRVA